MADRARWACNLAAALAVVLAAALVPIPGAAHALKVFALVEGGMIKGSVYFSGAAPARGARITVRDPDDSVIAEAITGDDGSFAVPLGPPVDHRIIADAPDGHSATFTVRAAEWTGGDPASAWAADGAKTPAPEPAVTPVAPVAPGAAEMEAVVETVVSRHVTALREQLNAYEDRLRWHDVLGGIGYILGLTGLAALFVARRRRGDRAPP